MSTKTDDLCLRTLETLTGFLNEIMGEFAAEIDITPETSFNADLELESIEFVQFAEMLQDQYGEQVNFADWLSQKDIKDIISLTVGDVVEFINEILTSKTAENLGASNHLPPKE